MVEIETWWSRCGCTKRPNLSCGEQGAMESEIDELRAYITKFIPSTYTEDVSINEAEIDTNIFLAFCDYIENEFYVRPYKTMSETIFEAGYRAALTKGK